MKFTFGTFVSSRPDEIINVRTLEQLVDLIETGSATEGVSDLDKLNQLHRLICGEETDFLTPLTSSYSEESKLFGVNRSFRDSLAVADNERCSRVAADWAETEPWRDTGINSMDLWGMLRFLSDVCARARAEDKELYLLLTN